jgi:hypothetical protein
MIMVLAIVDGGTGATTAAAARANLGTDVAANVDFTPSGTGPTARTVQEKLEERVSVMDFGAVCDGTTDDTAAVQAAVDHCLSVSPPITLLVPGTCLLTASVNINRLVDTNDNEFRIIGEGAGGGFHTAGNVVMFDSTIAMTTVPVSEFVTFQNIRFSSSSVFNESWVLSGKFLRMRFESCFFWVIRCLDSEVYAQSYYFSNCNIRNWPSAFFKSAGAYDISVTHSVIENGTGFMEFVDDVRGVLGLRILDNVIEGNSDSVLKCTGANTVTIGFNHLEGNDGPDFNFNAGILPGGTALAIGNFSLNPGGATFNWGLMDQVVSVANESGSPNPGTGTTMHGDVAFVANFTSIGDMAGTVSDQELPLRIGNIRAKGVAAYGRVTLAYSADMWPDARLGNSFTISANDGSAFIVRAPAEPTLGQQFTFTIRNVSGGALGAATWGASFKMAAWTQPANGFSRSIIFEYDGTDFIEVSRTAADVPN